MRVGWDVQAFAENLLPLVGGADVLEVGCGSGGVAMRLAVRARAVTGIDFTSALVENARRIAEESFHGDRVRFLPRDILTLDLHEKFDLVCGSAVLHEIPARDYPVLIERLKSHLKGDGAGFFLENNFFNPLYRLLRTHVVGRYGVPKVGSEHEAPFDQERYSLLADRFKFVERRCDVFLLLDRAWYQFAHQRLRRLAPEVARWTGAMMTRCDLAVTRRWAGRRLTLYWTWVPTIYFSDSAPRHVWVAERRRRIST